MTARIRLVRLAAAALAFGVCAVTSPLHAQPDFGDNTSRWADDGECDDPRFEGEGAANTLLEADNGHDANDCRKLFAAGEIALRAPSPGGIDFGDDRGKWARDGECDDPRFEGDGVAATLVDGDRYHDATDCRALFHDGRITLRGEVSAAAGDDASLRRGRLQKGDGRLESGEYADDYTFAGEAGQHAVIDLRSRDFDPYVFVRAPSGEQFDNDDFEGDASRSLLALDLAENGEYRVTVTSYSAGETGGYTLSIDVGQ